VPSLNLDLSEVDAGKKQYIAFAILPKEAKWQKQIGKSKSK